LHIFISYRRADCEQAANRLARDLQRELPQARIFLDTENPVPGPFPARIAREIRTADILLALIGPRWLPDGADTRDDDWVLRELTTALEIDVTVVPALVDQTSLPSSDQLPARLERLREQEAVSLRQTPNRDWDADVKEISRLLRQSGSTERLREPEQEPYVFAIYSALVRWIIYEAELSWRALATLLPVVMVLAFVGAVPVALDHCPRRLSLGALVASALGLLVALLLHSMVSRSRYFFKYRIDSATEIERSFPVPPDKAQLFRNDFFRGWGVIRGKAETHYQFSLLQRITMTDGQKVITASFMVLLLSLCIFNLVGAIGGH
jgi:hypothetical protein